MQPAPLSPYFTLPKGTIIKCPNPLCNDPWITKLKVDLRAGDRLSAASFVKDYGQGVCSGQKMQCKACNHHWFINDPSLCRIHTAKGWFPPDDQINEGLSRAKNA